MRRSKMREINIAPISSGDVFDMPILFITDLDVFGILNVSVTTSDDERGGLMSGI